MYEKIPNEMKQLNNWCNWLSVKVEESEKPNKEPWFVRNGKPYKAKITNPKHYSSFNQVMKDFILKYNLPTLRDKKLNPIEHEEKYFNGLGYIFHMQHNLCFVDIDNCIDSNGIISGKAKEIIALFSSYTEISQSQKGIHIFFYGNKEYIKSVLGKTGFKNTKENIEFYISARYCAITGNVYEEYTEIKDIDNGNIDIFLGLSRDKRETIKSYSPSPKMTDAKILEIIHKSKQAQKFCDLYNGKDMPMYRSQSEKDMAICSILAFYTQDTEQIIRILHSSGLDREKLHNRPEYLETMVKKAIGFLSCYYSPQNEYHEIPWDKSFVVLKNGKSIPILALENFRILCDKENIDIKYNEMSQEIEVNGERLQNKDDVIIKDLATKYKMQGANFSNIGNYINAVAFENSYHPVKTWFDSLILIDSSDEFDKLISSIKLIDIEKYEYARMLIKKWLISCVAAVYDENFISQGVLTLQGEPGIFKSTWLKNLVPDKSWFKGEFVGLDVNSRDSIQKAIKYWIVELSEIESTFRKEFIGLKGFITSEFDEYRAAYQRNIEKHKRRTVFCSSVNSKEFLRDDTGDRRFWIIEVEALDTNVSIDLSKLWGEVLYMYKVQNESYNLSPLENREVIQSNKEYSIQNKLDNFVASIIDNSQDEKFYTSLDIVDIVDRLSKIPDVTSTKVGRTLSKLGYKAQVKRINGKLKRVYALKISEDKLPYFGNEYDGNDVNYYN